MAERPVFVPRLLGSALIEVHMVSFRWHPGMAPSQKKKNVIELHLAAEKDGISPILEISSKSEREIGRKLSAFHLTIKVDGLSTTLECAFQSSKVFEKGGPYRDIIHLTSREAKKDERLKTSGNLVKFVFEETDYPLSPKTAFYDWLYINALYPHRDWLRRFDECAGFTDIEFNPERSLNCQARSCATYVALDRRGLLDDAIESFPAFVRLIEGDI